MNPEEPTLYSLPQFIHAGASRMIPKPYSVAMGLHRLRPSLVAGMY